MSGKLNTSDLSDNELIESLTEAQLMEYQEGWKPRGYGVHSFARWYLSLAHSDVPVLYESYLSRMYFAEAWWEASNGDVYLAEEAARMDLEAQEYVAFLRADFRALWKMRDFKHSGYGLSEITALNEHRIRIRKDLLELEDDTIERHLRLTRLLCRDELMQETSVHVARLLSEDKVIHYDTIPARDAADAILEIDRTVQRLFGDDGMKNYGVLLDIFDQYMLNPSITNGQSFAHFTEFLPQLTESSQVYTLASWIKAYGDMNCALTFEDDSVRDKILSNQNYAPEPSSVQV